MSARLHTLANGVRVVCDPMPLETLALSVVAGRGARSEDKTRSGWSHLLEHMVFKGAGTRSARDIVEAIEGQGGHVNAATGYERTSFQIRALHGGLPLGMQVLSDLVLRPTLDAGDLEREKQVVEQEIAEAADQPDDLVFDRAQTAAFGDTPLGRPILGTPQSIAAATPEGLEAWRAALYAPDALVVSAAGAVDEDELLALAEQAFGHLPADAGAAAPDPAPFAGAEQVEARKLEQAHIVLMLPAFGARDPDYFVLRLFAEALGGGMSSRLFQEVREVRGLAYAVDAYAETYADTGVLGVYMGCAAKDAAEASRVVAGQIAALADRIGEVELARAKAQLKGGLFMGREQPLNRAEQSAGQILLLGHTLSAAELAQAIDEVAPGDVARVGARLLAGRSSACAVLGAKPALKAGAVFTDALAGGRG